MLSLSTFSEEYCSCHHFIKCCWLLAAIRINFKYNHLNMKFFKFSSFTPIRPTHFLNSNFKFVPLCVVLKKIIFLLPWDSQTPLFLSLHLASSHSNKFLFLSSKDFSFGFSSFMKIQFGGLLYRYVIFPSTSIISFWELLYLFLVHSIV